MSNTEKINAYFDNELSAREKESLESRLNEDMELKREFDFQREIIEGIRSARSLQLKTMLDQVAVGGAGGATFGAGKVLGVIGLAAVIGFGIYYFYPENNSAVPESSNDIAQHDEGMAAEDQSGERSTDATTDDAVENSAEQTENPDAANDINAADEDQPVTEDNSSEEETTQPREEMKNPPVAPTFDNPSSTDDVVKTPENIPTGSAVVASESLEVEVEKGNRKYEFHYAFKNDKLILYGDFDQDLYEILEFNGKDGRSLFLNYQDSFYALTDDQGKVQPLIKVTHPALLKTLRGAIRE